MKIESLVLGELETNCYIVSSDIGSCAIIDPAAEAETIIKFIENRRYTPEYILVTHPHHDHIGAVKQLQLHYGAKVVISSIDYKIILDPMPMYGKRYIWKVMDKLFTADQLVEDGDVITMDELTFKVILTPGHTAGGVCYLCANHLFSGDTLFAGAVGRCDLYSGDFNEILRSVDRLADLPGDYDIYPGHGDATTMENERKHNEYIGMLKSNEDFY
ncbi:glyoxylase-like metal-dependent hydrolase (beta-lactamase superfamily II) [Hydrogenoanaerobacterium saccharovorans]|uniref:Glyoxylase, beta-lactamase superfamily II n=1 Tax=Hydrogenoanaerobacterium saccharovorans TaxID=474960 RepID=A0A1H7ZWA0_9FIRM|nr:MBL fold metallo-hydrolase [Hydrogenoanaerobacterium saccharovorans]RPF48333.1 glyoxylase-like metal-dependent hydrolase (beta-lactamase superfamily II) [Hydrogenoanaerobacterium saccharovorans]SEM62740.1 Glyoxylase, beta-lactamase superfamily II [Hydrogenoanaerobacterium saccharovorans]